MSKRRWDRLPPDDQSLLRAVAAESTTIMETLWRDREAAAEQRVRAAGVTVTEPSDRAAFERLMQPVWERFLSTPALRRLAQDIQSLGEAT